MTQSEIKFIKSLSQQKYRKEYNAYLVEGNKNAKEWMESDAAIKYVVAEKDWLDRHAHLIQKHPEAMVREVPSYILEKVSTLHTVNEVLLVVAKPVSEVTNIIDNWTIALEKVQDPGNMGTIIRTAAWFGIKHILCSEDCVEIYNPKVVQATMGGLLQVQVSYQSLPSFFESCTMPIYAACLQGQSLGTFKQPNPGIILMGNESKGLSDELLQKAQYKVTIPQLGKAESLNVAVAAGIICASFLLQ
jgi:TrmH family RNA methyltransferase